MAASKPLQYSYCGREYQFSSTDERSVEKFLCVICIQLLFEPFQTSCGHLFCYKCLKKWYKEKRTCPTCKTAFTGPALTDNFNNREVKNLTVLCPNVSRGCEWKGELGSVEAHKKDHCAYQLYRCPNKCGTAVERRELEEHKKDHCELREYECPYCKKDSDRFWRLFKTYTYPRALAKGPYKNVTTEHFKECLCYPVDCPNNCGAQGLVRGDLPSHLAACPEQVIPCRYQTLGCQVRLARKEMSGHLEDKDEHLVLAMGTTSDLANQLSEHKSSTDSQQQQITTLQQQVSVLLEKSGVQLPSAPQHSAKPWLKVDALPLYPPFTVKMDVSTKNEDFSPPFMTHPGGYRLRMRLQQYFHSSPFSYLDPVDCPENHSLKWPVTITIKLVILNQEEDKDHKVRKRTIKLDHWEDNYNVFMSDLSDTLKSEDVESPIRYIKILTVKTEP